MSRSGEDGEPDAASGSPNVEPFAIDVFDYEGIRVTCTVQQWSIKIDLGHPELSGEQVAVAEVIADPELVLQDRDYPDRRHLTRRTPEALYLVAVVEYQYLEDALRGRLVTAFLRRRLRSDDHVIFVSIRR